MGFYYLFYSLFDHINYTNVAEHVETQWRRGIVIILSYFICYDTKDIWSICLDPTLQSSSYVHKVGFWIHTDVVRQRITLIISLALIPIDNFRTEAYWTTEIQLCGRRMGREGATSPTQGCPTGLLPRSCQ